MLRRLYRQRRRLVLTPLLTGPVIAAGLTGPGETFWHTAFTQGVVFALLTLLVVILAPAHRRVTAAFVAVGITQAALAWSGIDTALPTWGRIAIFVACAIALNLVLLRGLGALSFLPGPALRASVTVPIDPHTTLRRYTGRDGTVWRPALARIVHGPEGYDEVYRAGIFAGMTARHRVEDYVPGRYERSTVHFIDAPAMLAGSTADQLLEATPVEGGTRLTLTERSHGLAPTYVWGAWLDDAAGATLDLFAERITGRRTGSTLAADYRARGIDLAPPEEAF